MLSESLAHGDWSFDHNTDGGALGGLAAGAWSIDVVSEFDEGIDAWAYLDGDGAPVPLQLDATANLRAFAGPSACRLDCTVPRCGDGVLDGGEACDDGNAVPGDGCSADCRLE